MDRAALAVLRQGQDGDVRDATSSPTRPRRRRHKNPYFKLIHDAAFCAKILRELGVDEEHGFIVNGHVPVKLDEGETPVKKSGRAITIDGAFAAAYGDKGFSLVLDADRIYLAQHHHFDGVGGDDRADRRRDVEVYDQPRTVGDTESRRRAARRDRRARAADHRFRDQHHSRGPGGDMTLLDQLTKMTVAVCDTGDINSIKKFTPRDATTNPSLITAAAQMPEYADVVDGTLAWAEEGSRAAPRTRSSRSRSTGSPSSSACAS